MRCCPLSIPWWALMWDSASFATLSTGEQIANPRFFRTDEKALAHGQSPAVQAGDVLACLEEAQEGCGACP